MNGGIIKTPKHVLFKVCPESSRQRVHRLQKEKERSSEKKKKEKGKKGGEKKNHTILGDAVGNKSMRWWSGATHWDLSRVCSIC